MSYANCYSDGDVIYSDSLRIDTYERDFLCFDWTIGSVSILNPYTVPGREIATFLNSSRSSATIAYASAIIVLLS